MRTKSLLATACIAVVVACVTPLSGELRLTIEPRSRQVAVGELVEYRSRLVNDGDQVAPISAELDPTLGDCTALLFEEGMLLGKYQGAGWSTMDVLPGERRLGPGESLEGTFSVLWTRFVPGDDMLPRGLAIQEPGQYEVALSLHTEEGEIVSNRSPIEVVEPTTVSDRRVFEALQRNQKLFSLIQHHPRWLLSESADQILSLRTLIAEYPLSVYSDQIRSVVDAAYETTDVVDGILGADAYQWGILTDLAERFVDAMGSLDQEELKRLLHGKFKRIAIGREPYIAGLSGEAAGLRRRGLKIRMSVIPGILLDQRQPTIRIQYGVVPLGDPTSPLEKVSRIGFTMTADGWRVLYWTDE